MDKDSIKRIYELLLKIEESYDSEVFEFLPNKENRETFTGAVKEILSHSDNLKLSSETIDTVYEIKVSDDINLSVMTLAESEDDIIELSVFISAPVDWKDKFKEALSS